MCSFHPRKRQPMRSAASRCIFELREYLIAWAPRLANAALAGAVWQQARDPISLPASSAKSVMSVRHALHVLIGAADTTRAAEGQCSPPSPICCERWRRVSIVTATRRPPTVKRAGAEMTPPSLAACLSASAARLSRGDIGDRLDQRQPSSFSNAARRFFTMNSGDICTHGESFNIAVVTSLPPSAGKQSAMSLNRSRYHRTQAAATTDRRRDPRRSGPSRTTGRVFKPQRARHDGTVAWRRRAELADASATPLSASVGRQLQPSRRQDVARLAARHSSSARSTTGIGSGGAPTATRGRRPPPTAVGRLMERSQADDGSQPTSSEKHRMPARPGVVRTHTRAATEQGRAGDPAVESRRAAFSAARRRPGRVFPGILHCATSRGGSGRRAAIAACARRHGKGTNADTCQPRRLPPRP